MSFPWTIIRASPLSAGALACSVSNRKELVDLGIFITLVALISHGHSLPKLFCAENGPPIKKSNSIFQNEGPRAL
jgi:hypothetical protein